MATENIRDMYNWVYLLEDSQRKVDANWTGKVCPHCIYTEECNGSTQECEERGGFMYKDGASDSENKEYIKKKIGTDIKFKTGSQK